MLSLVLIMSLILWNYVELITRMQTMSECTLRMNGWHNTQDHCIVCTIMVANLLDKDSNCNHVKDIPTTVKNPQANVICE
jgi:hypothetical protein